MCIHSNRFSWFAPLGVLLLLFWQAAHAQPPKDSVLEQAATEVEQVVAKTRTAIVTVRLESPNRNPSLNLAPGNRRATLVSSGFVVDSSGYIVCSADGAVGAGPFKVVLNDGQEVSASKVGADRITGIALLKVASREPLSALVFGNSDRVTLGSTAILIGNRYGLEGSVTVGTIGGIDRAGVRQDGKRLLLLLQFNAPVGAGEPGSPLLNSRGEVIGVIVGALSQVEGLGQQMVSNTAFAVPANVARRVVSDLRVHGKARHPWLGVDYRTHIRSVRVDMVVPNGPAEKAGLKANDVIVRVNGQPMTDATSLTRFLFNSQPNQTIVIEALRDGAPISLSVTLGEQILE